MSENTINKIKSILNIIIFSLLGIVTIVFSVLYIETFNQGILYKYSLLFETLVVIIVSVMTILSLIFLRLKQEFVFKICYIVVIFASLILIGLYLLKISGIMDKVDSVDDLRELVASFGGYGLMVVGFILLSFLQVVLLPIPAFVTVGAGTLLFGPFLGGLFSYLGILLGSIINFFVGRKLGYKVAAWLVGKENLDKVIASVKGKDKIVITFMFLFPLFPDDILCYVAGLSSMSVQFYLIMIVITRFISIFVSTYSYDGAIIPYDTWWGILLWAVFFVFVVLATIVIYKKGDKIEKFLKSKFSKRKHDEK